MRLISHLAGTFAGGVAFFVSFVAKILAGEPPAIPH